MVYRPPTHDILTHLPMVYQTLSYSIVNSSLLVEMGGGVQNTMTKIGPQGFSVRLLNYKLNLQWQYLNISLN